MIMSLHRNIVGSSLVLCKALVLSFVLFNVVFAGESFDLLSNEDEDIEYTGSDKLAKDSLLWGPYRSALYFGVRPKLPRSLLSGLMWFNMDNYESIGKIRHFYEQSDNMARANWVEYDPRYGGKQIIEDNDMHITITIYFVKAMDGLSWGAKIKAEPHKGYENTKTSFVWYSGMEQDPSTATGEELFQMIGNDDIKNRNPNITISGFTEDLGLFALSINDGPKTNRHPQPSNDISELDSRLTHQLSMNIPNDSVWKAKDVFLTIIQESLDSIMKSNPTLKGIPPHQAFIMRDIYKYQGNTQFIQKIYQGSCEFDIIFDSSVTPPEQRITFENIDQHISRVLESFNKKFNSSFELSAPYSHKEDYTAFAKEILSGLSGGISYFYGDSLVDRETQFEEDSFESYQLKGQPEGPFELFTLVPSRPFFPRGFYWDEGFHLLPLLNYDSDLVLEIIKSWFNLIDEDGWIAREQILGPESRSRVPEEFQVQSPQIVNPPTLMIVFTYLLESIPKGDFDTLNQEDFAYGANSTVNTDDLGSQLQKNPELLRKYYKKIYPQLQSHYEMFRRTQKGYVDEFDRGTNKEAYRWRGRTVTHCLASGLDDYPRALPADVAELNVDLLSWIGVMTRSIKLIARFLEYEQDYEKYSKTEESIIDNLNELHWSHDQKTYCDVSVDEDDNNVHVCHKGYISLLPFLTKLIKPDDVFRLSHMVDLISDPNELWSSYGIRSLSKSDEFYKTSEDYWRSPIWLQINYLVLDCLKHYKDTSSAHLTSAQKAKFSDTYHKLRLNLVENVFSEYKKTGFVWEQYNDVSGAGQGAKNFLGWSSSILLIMTMPENI